MTIFDFHNSEVTMFTGAWSALVTPFLREEGLIDFEAAERLILRQIEGGMDGIVIGGSTGESATLEEKELMELIDLAVKLGKDKLSVMAGTGTNSTKKTLRLTEMAKDHGAKGSLIVVPYYNKPTDRGVIQHFEELVKLEFPLMLYHNPARTVISLKCETIAQISQMDYVVGIKESSGKPGFTKDILEKNPNACILSGDDELAIEIIQNGGKGSISIIANLYPAIWKKVIDLALAENIIEAKQLYKSLEPLVNSILQEVNPQGIKCALSLLGIIEEAYRLPLVPVLYKTRQAIAKEIEAHTSSLLASALT